MNSLTRNWNNQAIRQREDGYLSATDMCKACGKRLNDWYRLDSTTQYLWAFASDTGIPVSQIVEVYKGNSSKFEQGTWVRRRVAIRLAQWLSPEFAVQVDKWVEELLLKGAVTITPHPLPPADVRVSNLINALDKLGLDFDNPRFKQGYQDLAHDILGVGQPVLPQSRDRWLGVVERAEELGHAPKLVVKYRSQLGKWIKSHGLTFKQEKRLCNGTHRLVNLYLTCDELGELIHVFMEAKLPQAL